MTFAFTHIELLDSCVTHTRLLALIALPGTVLHSVTEDANAYGEFLFVTLSAPMPALTWHGAPEPGPALKRRAATFFGLGYHEARERWLTDVWNWYPAAQVGQRRRRHIERHTALTAISERLTRSVGEASAAPAPSTRAQAFGLLADLTDDDGALAELEDLEALGVDVATLLRG